MPPHLMSILDAAIHFVNNRIHHQVNDLETLQKT